MLGALSLGGALVLGVVVELLLGGAAFVITSVEFFQEPYKARQTSMHYISFALRFLLAVGFIVDALRRLGLGVIVLG